MPSPPPRHERVFRVALEQVDGVRYYVISTASLARHIVDAMRDELLASPWLQGDATGFPILIGDLGHAHGGQLWVYSNGESAVFQVSMTKHAEFPRAFLDGFEGVWLADGASNYNAVASLPGVERGGCWFHVPVLREASLSRARGGARRLPEFTATQQHVGLCERRAELLSVGTVQPGRCVTFPR